ncbi:hypothetical protein DYB37_010411 [Aphanomyces astaci]|nr:hypothetical protein DYB36_004232 [Aphanomyces astaci]RHY64453.1 hypothetical protein DYB38_002794 [Aphanomyces astaci]RHY71608.1 hypothetical protein DYB34_004248 [Aphanomyces astaci]RHY97874.1 hypothetical protein DYB35_009450 [Aphanomyces astaci]RHZ07525.1 hypothetical protein DYB31_006722 [Aphanomyces astaci]
MLAQLKTIPSAYNIHRFRNSIANIMSLRGAIRAYLKHELLRRSTPDSEFQTIALGCLRKSNAFRRVCIDIVSWAWFDRFITLCVLVNTLMLGFVDYTNPWADGPNPTRPANRAIDLVSTASLGIFMCEVVLKIVAHGLLWGPHSYFSDGWNRLDFLIVMSG